MASRAIRVGSGDVNDLRPMICGGLHHNCSLSLDFTNALSTISQTHHLYSTSDPCPATTLRRLATTPQHSPTPSYIPLEMVPWRIVPCGVVLRVRATPRSRTDAIKGVVDLPGSGSGGEAEAALSVSITAAPEGGAANAAIVATLAKALGVPKSAVRIAAGGTARVKRIEIDTPDVDKLVARLKIEHDTGGVHNLTNDPLAVSYRPGVGSTVSLILLESTGQRDCWP